MEWAEPSHSWLSPINSERKPRAQFHHAISVTDITTLVTGTGDAPEVGGGQAHSRIAEVRRVGHAKRLRTELEPHFFPYWESAEHCGIEVEEPGAGELVTSHVSQHPVSSGL